jgi:hypothetical protein
MKMETRTRKKQRMNVKYQLDNIMKQIEIDFLQSQKRDIVRPLVAPTPPLINTKTAEITHSLSMGSRTRRSSPIGMDQHTQVRQIASAPPTPRGRTLHVTRSCSPVAPLSISTGPFAVNPPVSVVDSIIELHSHNTVTIDCVFGDTRVECRVPWLILLPLWNPSELSESDREDCDDILSKIVWVIRDKFARRNIDFHSQSLQFQVDGYWYEMNCDHDLVAALDALKGQLQCGKENLVLHALV